MGKVPRKLTALLRCICIFIRVESNNYFKMILHATGTFLYCLKNTNSNISEYNVISVFLGLCDNQCAKLTKHTAGYNILASLPGCLVHLITINLNFGETYCQ